MRTLLRWVAGLMLATMAAPGSLHAAPFVVPTMRPSIGAFWLLTPDQETGVAFHLPVGAAIGWAGSGLGRIINTTPWVLPEVAYELRSSGHHSSHALSLGCGVGYGILGPALVSYTPRLLIGRADEQVAVGLRHGIAAHGVFTFFYLELSHQVLYSGGITSQEIQLGGGLNLGAMLIPALW